MTPQELPAALWLIIKALTILGLCIYAIFAAVIVRQEHLMSHVLEENFEPVLRLLSFIHLIAAIGMILLAFVLL